MKANEAPEKIYISVVPSEFGGNKTITCGKDFPNAVEYTRTDAFIEKAVRILEHYLDNSVWVSNDVGVREKEVIIEDFEEYLRK